MTFAACRIIWITAAVVGGLSLLCAESTIDENNIVHDSALLPLGWVLFLIALAFFILDMFKTVTRR